MDGLNAEMLPARSLTFPRLFILLTIALWSLSGQAQDLQNNPDQVYGFDPLLYNGLVYSFYPHPGTGGTQYLFDAFDRRGSVTLRGVTYSNLTLNYDIFNHQLIMEFKNGIGSQSSIQISYGWLEKASLGGSNFAVIAGADSNKRIYQVIGDGHKNILYYQSKDLLMDNTKIKGSHYFSAVRKTMFVMINDQITAFKNNAGFLKAFSQSDKSLIKVYMRIHNINVKKASDRAMTEMINYCNTLPGS